MLSLGAGAVHIEIRPDRQSITSRGARVMYASDPERKSEIPFLPGSVPRPPPRSSFLCPCTECLFLLLRSGERYGELRLASDPHQTPLGPRERGRDGVGPTASVSGYTEKAPYTFCLPPHPPFALCPFFFSPFYWQGPERNEEEKERETTARPGDLWST